MSVVGLKLSEILVRGAVAQAMRPYLRCAPLELHEVQMIAERAARLVLERALEQSEKDR